MTTIWVESISLFGQGLAGWQKSKDIFRDTKKYNADTVPPIESRYLTPNNKRRTSPHMHIAMQAADYALMDMDVDETEILLISSSSEADMDIAEDNLQALIHAEREISPQKFQNVILNAAAGHLGTFMKNRSGSTSVSGANNCFSVGLLQAYTSLFREQKKALLVAYDAPSNTPYGVADRPFFSVGMLLCQEKPKNPIAGLMLSLVGPKETTLMAHPHLEKLRSITPSATCLPLLAAVANAKEGPVELYYSEELSLLVTLCF